MFYLELFQALHDRQVRYLLIGGLAVNLHGIPRATMDIDLLLPMDDGNLRAFMEAARALGLEPRLPLALDALADPVQRDDWVKNRNLIAFALARPGASAMTVDVLLVHPLDAPSAERRAIVLDVRGTPVRLVSVEDLITLKTASARRQDLADIELLRKIHGRQVHE